jgi:hypothetical protein
MYEEAVRRLTRAADQVAQYRSDLATFADALAGRGWGEDVTGALADLEPRFAELEGAYRDLAAEMGRQGDEGAAAHEQAPWVPDDLAHQNGAPWHTGAAGEANAQATLIGTRVEYRGSLEDAWGRYVIAAEVPTDDEPRYELATYAGVIAVHNVRSSSFTPVPAGPKHVVLAAQARANVAQGEFGRQFELGEWNPDIHEFYDHRLPGYIADLIRANRPVEAEQALLNAELFVGSINRQQFYERIDALVIAGDDESGMPPEHCPQRAQAPRAGITT